METFMKNFLLITYLLVISSAGRAESFGHNLQIKELFYLDEVTRNTEFKVQENLFFKAGIKTIGMIQHSELYSFAEYKRQRSNDYTLMHGFRGTPGMMYDQTSCRLTITMLPEKLETNRTVAAGSILIVDSLQQVELCYGYDDAMDSNLRYYTSESCRQKEVVIKLKTKKSGTPLTLTCQRDHFVNDTMTSRGSQWRKLQKQDYLAAKHIRELLKGSMELVEAPVGSPANPVAPPTKTITLD
jgi:hypothetical protein